MPDEALESGLNPLESFRSARIDPQLLTLARGTCLVEFNADAYTDYLCRVFDDDAELQTQFRAWGKEEKQHGLALRKWVQRFAYRTGNYPNESIEQARSKEYSAEFLKEISRLYNPEHYQMILGLATKVVSIRIDQRIRRVLGYADYGLLRLRYPTANMLAP